MPYYAAAPEWIRRAEELRPKLYETITRPQESVRVEADAAAFGGWKSVSDSSIHSIEERLWTTNENFTLDFQSHQVGTLSFQIAVDGELDSPVRLRLVFAEQALELAHPFDPFTGTLSRAWLQDETLTLDALPPQGGLLSITLPRRYAFRYVRVEIVAAHPFRLRLRDFSCRATTSADLNQVTPIALPSPWKEMEEISRLTLQNCMQTVFEDGPKRDRRLWLGDLRLESLANSVTFRNFPLVQRCLYLFASLSDENGYLSGCLYEHPTPHFSKTRPTDYPLLFGPLLYEYAQASGDWETARELFPVALRQLEFGWINIAPDGLWHKREGDWLFIDWNDDLRKEIAMAGVLAFSVQQITALAEKLGRQEELQPWKNKWEQLRTSTRAAYWNPEKQVAIDDGQISWLSQAWLTLGGILTPSEGAVALRTALHDPQAIRPLSPYACHTVVEALLHCGLESEAASLLREFWGSMIPFGFTTFPEIWNPTNHYASPYGNALLNSACHAWSCTPTYFLRRWPHLATL